ncbi:hypothetical protein ACCC92_26975 [Mucilaginibacter sp. Mucisp84]|uniref:hypothetical protein n=1 Tax=Mucilaginibacter sp. Mucisp84 TaxID=3243058 RepID=UPI0039A6D2AF
MFNDTSYGMRLELSFLTRQMIHITIKGIIETAKSGAINKKMTVFVQTVNRKHAGIKIKRVL